jgi:NAD(P)-dependent dehydrogenase (short-subunit alcohol dehydrogenase family)
LIVPNRAPASNHATLVARHGGRAERAGSNGVHALPPHCFATIAVAQLHLVRPHYTPVVFRRVFDSRALHSYVTDERTIPLMENADFAERVAVVTGAWRGLGRAAAARLHERGASVAVNVRSRERTEALAKEIGERAFAVPGDVAAEGVPDEIARRTFERFGRIDILVNNAALPLSTRFPDLTAEEWRRAIEVNLTAPFLMTKAVLPAMRAQHYGRIINISSSAGRMVSTLGGAHYTASKAGLLGLTRAAAKELGKFGITVNAVCPGMIDTELTREHASDEVLEGLAASYPVPRLGTALEVADLICFAASEAAGYITGASLDINGGDLMM